MRDESLHELLVRADETVGPPAHVSDLAARVRRADRRRRLSIRAAAALLLVGGLIGLMMAPRFMRPSPAVVKVTAESTEKHIQRLRAEALQLGSDATMHERVADGLLQMNRRSAAAARWQRAMSVADPLEDVKNQRDRAAEILLRGAERMEEQPDGAARAMDVYRQTARMFGDTAAGREAALRVKSQKV